MDGNSGATTQDNSGANQNFESYKKVKVLGQGSFGKAFLVQAESDGVSGFFGLFIFHFGFCRTATKIRFWRNECKFGIFHCFYFVLIFCLNSKENQCNIISFEQFKPNIL